MNLDLRTYFWGKSQLELDFERVIFIHFDHDAAPANWNVHTNAIATN
jgi:hypothetical protein